jgi:hypothetical protein
MHLSRHVLPAPLDPTMIVLEPLVCPCVISTLYDGCVWRKQRVCMLPTGLELVKLCCRMSAEFMLCSDFHCTQTSLFVSVVCLGTLCVYVCAYSCLFVCMYVCMHVLMYVHVHVCTSVWERAAQYIYMRSLLSC